MGTVQFFYKVESGGRVLGSGIYHKYLVYTDDNNVKWYIGGYPTNIVPFFGKITTEKDLYLPGTIDFDAAQGDIAGAATRKPIVVMREPIALARVSNSAEWEPSAATRDQISLRQDRRAVCRGTHCRVAGTASMESPAAPWGLITLLGEVIAMQSMPLPVSH